jgi:hypothetical protein
MSPQSYLGFEWISLITIDRKMASENKVKNLAPTTVYSTIVVLAYRTQNP